MKKIQIPYSIMEMRKNVLFDTPNDNELLESSSLLES